MSGEKGPFQCWSWHSVYMSKLHFYWCFGPTIKLIFKRQKKGSEAQPQHFVLSQVTFLCLSTFKFWLNSGVKHARILWTRHPFIKVLGSPYNMSSKLGLLCQCGWINRWLSGNRLSDPFSPLSPWTLSPPPTPQLSALPHSPGTSDSAVEITGKVIRS